jgi:hypothetical protein
MFIGFSGSLGFVNGCLVIQIQMNYTDQVRV